MFMIGTYPAALVYADTAHKYVQTVSKFKPKFIIDHWDHLYSVGTLAATKGNQ
jgi:hypothetical protein